MKTNLRLSEAPHIEKVARRNLVTLLSVINGGCDQSVKQLVDWRTEGALLGQRGDIGPPSMGPNLHKVILLWRSSDTTVQKFIKMRTHSLLINLNSYMPPWLDEAARAGYAS